MADEEKKGKEVLTDAQKAAKAFLKAKAKAVREKAVAQKEVDDLKELRTKRQKKLREAEQALESFKNDDILLALAGLEKEKDEKAYKEAAAECLFALLAKIHKSDDKEQVNDKANEKPSLQEQIQKLNPSVKLFEILKEVAAYDEKTKRLSIDVIEFYTQIGDRIKEQNKLIEKAKTTYKELEATVEAEVEAKKTKVAQARKAKKGKVADKVSDDSLATDEKIVVADSGESDNKVLEDKKPIS